MHAIVGSGPVGTATARLLADQGEQVRMITRSGSGPDHPLIERVAASAADRDRLVELTKGAEVLYNCANPPYTDWETKWPPMSDAMIAAAKANDLVYAITGNLYVYGGPLPGPMTEHSPLAATGRKGKVRIKMWQDALNSGVRTVEARGSDYIGERANSVFSFSLLPAIEKNRAAWCPADIDQVHSFTYTGDMARTLVTLARDERAWGKAWHVPSADPITIRDLAQRYFRVSGTGPVALHKLPRWTTRAAGLFWPMGRELAEMDYQFWAPFRLDSTLTQQTFGLKPTDLDVALREVADHAAATAARTM